MAATPAFYRSVIAECRLENYAVKEIRLHPIDLGFGLNIGQRVRPLLADERLSHEILAGLQGLCGPFGTRIGREGNLGVIRLGG
jgi:hypothetical protein